jgi:hypothetical protein
MKTILNKIAAILAFIIGGMAIFAGGQTLLGKPPSWSVLSWLPLYNYTAGILTVFIVAVLIWKNSKYALTAAIGMFSLHVIVMIILQTAFAGMVAAESIQAMTSRLITWIIILGLMFVQRRLNKGTQTANDAVLPGKVSHGL